MTINIPAKTTTTNVLVYHHEQDGVKGYLMLVGTSQVFVAEADADKLARYMLFTPPAQNEEHDESLVG